MPKNVPRFQQTLSTLDTDESIGQSLQKSIRSFYMPLKHDMQFTLINAMKDNNLEREDIYVSIPCTSTIGASPEAGTCGGGLR